MKYLIHTFLFLFLFLLLAATARSQNLIPNSDFEQIECPDNNINSISDTPSWYACTGADAYWLHEDCPLDPVIAESVFFINPNTDPYSGVGYISLEGVLTLNGYIASEGVGIELSEPLQAGRAYFFQMAVLFQPERISNQHPGNSCPSLPDRFMEVHVGQEKILVKRESDILDVTTEISSNAELVLVDRTSVTTENFNNNQWYVYADCFLASGGETHIGITGSNYQLAATHGCVNEGLPGASYLFGYSIDDTELLEIPTTIEASRSICDNGGWINLDGVVTENYFDIANFLWEDGCTETRRVIRQAGVYQVDMILPCITVPITLDITNDGFCEEVVYTEEMPESVEDKIVICTDEGPATILLLDYVPEALQSEVQFSWADGFEGVTRTLESSGMYEIWAITPCFAFPIRLEAELLACQTKIFVPNAFSPNLDGVNDVLHPFINSPWLPLSYQFQVFDRWGQLVFGTSDPANGWDGKINGKAAEQGIFIWSLEYDTGQEEGGTIALSGDVMLFY